MLLNRINRFESSTSCKAHAPNTEVGEDLLTDADLIGDVGTSQAASQSQLQSSTVVVTGIAGQQTNLQHGREGSRSAPPAQKQSPQKRRRTETTQPAQASEEKRLSNEQMTDQDFLMFMQEDEEDMIVESHHSQVAGAVDEGLIDLEAPGGDVFNDNDLLDDSPTGHKPHLSLGHPGQGHPRPSQGHSGQGHPVQGHPVQGHAGQEQSPYISPHRMQHIHVENTQHFHPSQPQQQPTSQPHAVHSPPSSTLVVPSIPANSTYQAVLALSAQLSQISPELESTKSELQNRTEENESLKLQLQSSEEMREDVKKERDELNKKIFELNQQQKHGMNEIVTIKQQHQRYVVDWTARLELAETEVNRNREILKVTKTDYEEQRATLEKIKHERDVAKDAGSSLHAENDSRAANLQQMSKKLAALQEQAEKQLNEAAVYYQKAAANFEKADKECKEYKSRNEALSLEIENTKSELRNETQLKEQFKERTDSLQIRNQELDHKDHQSVKRMSTLDQRLHETAKDMDNMTRMKESYMDQLIHYKERVRTQDDKLSEFQGTQHLIDQVEGKLEVVQSENQSLKSSLYDESRKYEKIAAEKQELLSYVGQLLKDRGR